MSSEQKSKPSITPSDNGPYIVKDLDSLQNRNGTVDVKSTMSLCRCGSSANKPFCDGMHAAIGFSSAKIDGRNPDKREDFEGIGITVHDNRGLCAHAGFCTDGLPAVFRIMKEPFVNATAATAEEIASTVRKCPSGALSVSQNRVASPDPDRSPGIIIAQNGPYIVRGGPLLKDTERNEGASNEHFALCRCGGSKNKPFCDGTHWKNGFKDDKN
jgi:CDGSH-type Zn-finger protein